MRVTGIQTIKKEISVDINQDELFRLLDNSDIPLDKLLKLYKSKVIRNLFGINCRTNVFIEDGFFCYEEEESGGSHSWFVTEKIREATDSEQEIMNILKLLKDIEITYKMEK